MIKKSFEDNYATGSFGENLVEKNLQKWFPGCVYPQAGNARHVFDGMVYSLNHDVAFLYDVKTKPAMFAVPETGYNRSHFLAYKKASATLHVPFVVFFVDWAVGCCYWHDALSAEDDQWHLCSWKLRTMYFFFELSKEERQIMEKAYYEKEPNYANAYKEKAENMRQEYGKHLQRKHPTEWMNCIFPLAAPSERTS